MLHVFAVEGLTACVERSGNDQAVVKAELITVLQIEATLVKRTTEINLPQWQQDLVEKFVCIVLVHRHSQLSCDDVKCLLYHLKTDDRVTTLQCPPDQSPSNSPFASVVLIKRINTDNAGNDSLGLL